MQGPTEARSIRPHITGVIDGYEQLMWVLRIQLGSSVKEQLMFLTAELSFQTHLFLNYIRGHLGW